MNATLATVIHFGPQSEWAKRAPAPLHDKAATWAKLHPLFRLEPPGHANTP